MNAPAAALPRPSAARAWLLAARPATLTAGAVPVAVGTALAAADGRWDPLPAAGALLGALAIQVGTNLHNDLCDFRRGADTAERLGPPRATQRGWLTPGQVRAGAALSFGLAALIGAGLVAHAGWPILVLGLASLASGLAYTGGPWPLAYLGLGEVFVLAFFGVGAVAGTYYVQALALSPAAAVAGLALGALGAAILVVNNLRDREGDARVGKRTLAVRLGPTGTRWEYAALLAAAYLALPAAWLAGLGQPPWLLPWLSLPLAARELRGVWRRDGAELNQHLGGTARLQLVWGALLVLGVLLP